jgi:50S ribosomal protein L16 3-hydroxylase
MLYLPPGWAHDGVAEGDDCMTCSVGFRVPEETGLTRELLLRWADELSTPEVPALYRDPKQLATSQPGRIPEGLQSFAAKAVTRLLSDPQGLMSALGEVLTEPKPNVWFEAGEPLADGQGVYLDARTKMMYDDRRIFANGESWLAAGKDARALQQLADERRLSAQEVGRCSAAVR